MSPSRVLPGCLALLVLSGAAARDQQDILYSLTDVEYYEMPTLFELDEWRGCVSVGGAYCLGSFELTPPTHTHEQQLYTRMKRYSANWVDNFNHTRVHRGRCLPRSCRHVHSARDEPEHVWFSKCVNESTMSSHNLSARLWRLQYCSTPDEPREHPEPLVAPFGAALAALLVLAVVSTVLDVAMPDTQHKGRCRALLAAWSLRGSWRALHAPSPGGGEELRALDGLRVLCMMCVIIEHVCWLATQAYLADTRQYEQMRRDTDVTLMINSTLVVQIFFLMSSFLLAHKILSQRSGAGAWRTFADTMLNRLIRVSPSYFLVLWGAASWWAGSGRGPLWEPLVGAEAAVCRRKWWTHLMYLNNVVQADDKCLIQTWYLAADMQLYALALVLTLVLRRWRRAALAALAALLAACVALLFALAYAWRLVPTYVMHSPELVRAVYSGESSFNVLYQSPLSNAPGALAGLLLAHIHHQLLERGVRLRQYKVFRWVSVASPPLGLCWAALSPRLLGAGPPARGAAAALAALERPVFSLFVSLGLLGAMHHVESPLRSLLAWPGWRTPARLSFGVLLLHLPLNKTLVASILTPMMIDRQTAILTWFGVALVSYMAALPLSLLVELPALRVHRALTSRPTPAPAQPPTHAPAREKDDM